MNYSFFDNSEIPKVAGIAKKWRQFTQWHNAGFDKQNCTGGTTDFDPCYVYNLASNFQSPINCTLNYLRECAFDNGLCIDPETSYGTCDCSTFENGADCFTIDFFYPAFNSSISNLSSKYFYNGVEQGQEVSCPGNPREWQENPATPNERMAIWRKPVPFTETIGSDICQENFLSHEPFNETNSYRFFSEYLGYYTGFFGQPKDDEMPMPSYLNYAQENVRGNGWNNHMELWNEPDAWFTWPNNYGYFTPKELSHLCDAAIGGKTTTTINNETFIGGIHTQDEDIQLISPSPHEMDVAYFNEFLMEMDKRIDGFQFDINAFHHYSAYNIFDLANLLSEKPTPDDIVAQSVNSSTKEYTYNLPSLNTGTIKTVTLESNPSNPQGVWICPELDGYMERGDAVYDAIKPTYDIITGNETDPQIWITEWGYPAFTGARSAKYPSSVPGGEETQGQWLMRGYLEYDRSKHIQASFWHWFQDSAGGGNEWDNTTGVLRPGSGARRTAWYYLQTMINEIGDKSFFDDVTLPGCKEDYVPSFDIDEATSASPTFVAEDPIENCPRIYKYASDCCLVPGLNGEPDQDADNFLETVWVIWFPYMVDRQTEMLINIEDLNVVGIPQEYFYVEPRNGIINGYQSEIFELNPNQNGDRFVSLPVSEKPIFLHFIGECPCDNENPIVGPDVCNPELTITLDEQTCTSLSYNINFSTDVNCASPNITTVTAFNNIQGVNTGYTVDNIGNGQASITFTGLSPDTEYDFSISIGYQVEIDGVLESGTFNNNTIEEADDRTTLSDGCFSDLALTVSHSDVNNCQSANLNFSITASEATDVSPLVLNASIAQVESTCSSSANTAPMNLSSVFAIDWQNLGTTDIMNQDNTITSISTFLANTSVNNLSPGGCYCIAIEVIDNNGVIYLSQEYDFCLEEAECNDALPPVSILKSDCVSTCFAPTTYTFDTGKTTCVSGYRLEIYDAANNKVERFIDFGNMACNRDELCFEGDFYTELLAGLGAGPYIGNIISIFDLPGGGSVTTSSDFFPVEAECCLEDFELDVQYSTSCNSAFAYLNFCLDDFRGCSEDFRVSVDDLTVLVNGNTQVRKVFTFNNSAQTGENCFLVQIGVVKPQCQDIPYVIKISGSSPEFNREISGIIPYFGCCLEDPDPPFEPTGLRLAVNHVVNVNEKVVIEATLSDALHDITLESRDNGISPRYVLDKKIGSIEQSEVYYDNLIMSFEAEDLEHVSQMYNIHLLANQKVFELNFSEDVVGERSINFDEGQNQDVVIYPNPSQSVVNIKANENITELKILSIDGKVIFEKQYLDKIQEVSSLSLPKGVHFVKVNLVSGKEITKKVIILE